MRSQAGLTLIELMTALAVAAVVVLAAMGVLANLSRAQVRAERTHGRDSLEVSLARLLSKDFAHAEEYRVLGKRLELRSRAALDPLRLELRHLQATVRYTATNLGAGGWLVREQESVHGGTFRELVCSGVRSIAISQKGVRVDTTRGWRPAPPTVHVVVELAEGESSMLEIPLRKDW